MNFLSSFIEKTGMNKAQASRFIKAFKEAMSEGLAADEVIWLPGVGKFKTVKRAKRKGRNPQTGKSLTIKAHKAVKFTPAKAVKEMVNEG